MATASYQFTLQPQKQSSYLRIELMVVLLHLATFIIVAVNNYSKSMGMAVTGIAVSVIYLVLYFSKKQHNFRSSFLQLPIFFFGLWWLYSSVYLMALLVFTLGVFAIIAKKKVQVIINQDEVLYQSFPKRQFTWQALNNVLLKDGMLTLDFKNNKIIQQLIEETNIDESAFNVFCQKQLGT
jgi:O-antigen/teichoic acid export membrane protein